MSWVSTYEVAKTVWNAGYIATMNFTYVTEKQFVPYKSVLGEFAAQIQNKSRRVWLRCDWSEY